MSYCDRLNILELANYANLYQIIYKYQICAVTRMKDNLTRISTISTQNSVKDVAGKLLVVSTNRKKYMHSRQVFSPFMWKNSKVCIRMS